MGYDTKNQAAEVLGVLDDLGVRTAELVTHDIGIMVGFAVAATDPERVSRWVAIDAPLAGRTLGSDHPGSGHVARCAVIRCVADNIEDVT